MSNINLILTVGCSGSGKSTYAKKQGKTVIERDEIRELLFPGYWKSSPDPKKEKIVTQERDKQIRAALTSGVTDIIFSDTNLNQKYIDATVQFVKSLNSHYEVKVQIEYFDDSLNFELCRNRNLERTRQVPDFVLCEQWRRYQNLRGSKENYILNTKKKPVLFVSDLHGEFGIFCDIYQKYFATHKIVLLGDLNDPRYEQPEDNFSGLVSSLGLIRELIWYTHKNSQDAPIVLASNHQRNLIKLLRGQRKKLSHGLQNTLAEFVFENLVDVELDLEKQELISLTVKDDEVYQIANWLDRLPACIQIFHNGEDWRASHAYVPSEQSREYRPFPNKYEKYIYGPTRHNGQGYGPWWVDLDNSYTDITTRNFKFICGHNHVVYMGKNVIVNDPDPQGQIGLVFFEDGEEPRFELWNTAT
jgi:predicted kinase